MSNESTRMKQKKKIRLKSLQSMNTKMSVRGLVNRHYDVTYLFKAMSS